MVRYWVRRRRFRVKVNNGEITMAQKPRELKLTSHSKEEEFIMKEDDIFDDKKKEQFKVFGLIHQTRSLIEGEIVQRMYPSEVLMKLNDDTDLENTDEENFISYRLQDAILPWPLNMMHILPDWLIITVLGIVGLLLLKVVFDPMVACLTLIGDSSLSIIQRLSSIIVPAATISWMNNRKNPQLEHKELEDVENRISELEDEMQLFKNLMVKGSSNEATKRLTLAEESL